LGTALGTATGVVAVFFHRASLLPWILLALLFWQLQETARRALMSRLRHRDAIWGDALSYLGQAACVGYLCVGHRLTLASAFGAMAGTSMAGLLLQMVQLKLSAVHFSGTLRLLPRFWGLGRWALLANVAQGFMGQALLWFLALAGMAEVAAFQAVLNLLRVGNPVMFAVGSVVLPSVAIGQGNSIDGLQAAKRYSLLGSAVLLPYLGFIFIAPGFLLRLLYGAGSVYSGLGLELRILVLGFGFVYFGHVLGSYFYGLARSDIVLRCQAVAAIATVVAGAVLAVRFGVLGAAIGYDLSALALAVAFIWFLRRGFVTYAPTGLAVGSGTNRLTAKSERG
jgi:O-antigen/teichoic acid export membrane protein